MSRRAVDEWMEGPGGMALASVLVIVMVLGIVTGVVQRHININAEGVSCVTTLDSTGG